VYSQYSLALSAVYLADVIPAPRLLTTTLLLAAAPGAASAQSTAPSDSVTASGVFRASAVVDSVFVDRLADSGFVGAGDWAAYLMARLGVIPIPPDLRIKVVCDTLRIRLSSRLGDLPYEARRALGPLVGMLPPETEIAGDITLSRAAREVVRFHLETVRLNGIPVPDPLVYNALQEVGRQYPALTRSGRDLFVEVPLDATVALAPGGVRLLGPPADSTARPKP
jgi:hypothetical protein